VEWRTRDGCTGSARVRPLKTTVSTGKWIGTFYGVAAGGLEQRGAFYQSLHFDLEVEFARLTGSSALEGLTGVAGVRYRDGLNVNNFAGASSTFNPSTIKAASNGASCHPFSHTQHRNCLE
jgi:hypothetical protein